MGPGSWGRGRGTQFLKQPLPCCTSPPAASPGCQRGLARRSGAHLHTTLSPHSSREADNTVPLPIGGLSYVQGLTKHSLIHKTVGQCLEATAQRVPDREALVVPQENIRLTFAQLKEEVRPDLEPSKWAGASPQAAMAGWAELQGRSWLGGGGWGCPRTPGDGRSRGQG